MGDPRKARKKYTTPKHPWKKERIEVEGKLDKEYGFKNRTELWKMSSKLKNFKDIAKKNIASTTKQSAKERQQLLQRLQRLGLVKETATLDEILSITLRDVLERRLQTIIYKKGYARSTQQARQFITHGHIIVGNKKIDSPSHLVTVEEEPLITFKVNSTLADAAHPERIILEKSEEKKPKPKKEERRFKRK